MFSGIRSSAGFCEHGTLVITVPCFDGLVICADKRVTSEDGIASDHEVKICQIAPKAAFSATGMSRAQSADPAIPDFELFQSVRQAASDINFNYFNKHLGRAAKAIAHDFSSTIRTLYHPKLEPQKVGCQVLFWHIDAANNLHGTRIDIDYDEERAPEALDRVHDLDGSVLTGPCLAGDCDPFSSLRDTARADLQSLRDDQRFQRFQELKTPEQWHAISPEEAMAIGGYLINACSQIQVIDGLKAPNIGPNCDSALLSLSRQFVWLK